MILRRALVAIAAVAGSLAVARAQNITSQDLLDGLANQTRWLTYSGDYSGQRHSPLTQLTVTNVANLSAQWTFQTGVAGKFETSPLVIDGVLYATGPLNHAWAIDARTGKMIWRYQRTLPTGIKACCGLVNRGFAVYRDRLYLATLDANLVALDIRTGKVLFEVALGDYKAGIASTGAPLIVKDKVIVGMAGGEFATRGFLDAYDPMTGTRLWRFWAVPAPGEPGGDTWPPGMAERGGGPTWLTGTYDPELNLLYWGIGNPNPDFYGANRSGDNLYTGSVVALDPDTGALRWHYQFTPHDTHDWDANEIPVLGTLRVAGAERKVMMFANRNGFFYVLDRATGKVVHAKPFVAVTWAKEIGADGRPVEVPGQAPSAAGTLTCPDLFGGTNFMSPAFNPSTGLFYVSAREVCATYIAAEPPQGYKPGDRTMGGNQRPGPERGTGALRAIDPTTLEIKWELKHEAPSWAGVLSTAGGLVFSGDNDGKVFALDARSGKLLWQYQTGAPIYAPPITYMLDGRQYMVMPAGTNLTAFALHQSSVVSR
jgi:alcohol dehydrogenase (cytochrome c)